ncbi:MAG: GNAT family N-acetyltransferase [Candidatus Bathyarchaeia archaeon]
MQIIPLGSSLENMFWQYISKDIPHHFFFAFDWKYNRNDTEILLALEGNRIEGMMLVYRQSVVQFRGSCEAVRMLLERLNLEKIELQALEEHAPYILEKYTPTVTHRMMLMIVRRGEEKSQVKCPVVNLDASDAEQIAAIMRESDPEFWGTATGQGIVDGMSRGVKWLGVKINGKAVSVGSMRITEWGGLIGTVATHKDYRNKGYAASIVSELVKQMLKEVPWVIIYVLADNAPAIRAYEKTGFKHYRTYFFMRGEKRKP